VGGNDVPSPALLIRLQLQGEAAQQACQVTRHLKHWEINHPENMPGASVEVKAFGAAAPPLLQRMLEHGGAKLA
jgi:hypothetical protein